MSAANKKIAFKADANARFPAILAKVNEFVGGDRSEEEQLELVTTGLIVLVDILRGLQGDKVTQGFLQAAIRDVAAGKRTRFSLQVIDKRLSH